MLLVKINNYIKWLLDILYREAKSKFSVHSMQAYKGVSGNKILER